VVAHVGALTTEDRCALAGMAGFVVPLHVVGFGVLVTMVIGPRRAREEDGRRVRGDELARVHERDIAGKWAEVGGMTAGSTHRYYIRSSAGRGSPRLR
jgi:hypothetical protein